MALSDPQVWKPGLGYGPDEGYTPLRREVAKWLTSFYKNPISMERVAITGGASQNLACLLQTFTDPVFTRKVFMVMPTYYLACRIFDDSGFAGRLKGVPEDVEGIDIAFLEQQLKLSEDQAQAEGNLHPRLKPSRPWRKIYKYIIYAVPSFANPSGRVMSLRRREELVRLARKYDALIITDDVYDMLLWPSSPKTGDHGIKQAYVQRIVDVDRYLDGGPIDDFGNAVSNGSFSKIVGPGCRTGWAEGTEKMVWGVSQTGSSRSGGCPSHLTATLISQMLENSVLTKHIFEELQPAYARRYHVMLQAIQEELLPLGLTMPLPEKHVAGGYFIWLTLPKGLKADEIGKRALHEQGLVIGMGTSFQVQGDAEAAEQGLFEHDIRVCFAWAEEDLLAEGVRRLAKVIREALSAMS